MNWPHKTSGRSRDSPPSREGFTTSPLTRFRGFRQTWNREKKVVIQRDSGNKKGEPPVFYPTEYDGLKREFYDRFDAANGSFSSDQTFLPGIDCSLRSIRQVQFAQDVADVPLDRSQADHELIGDSLV